ncbi:unnamed protein product, partial [Mesorhabditis spiculigera]
MSLLAQVYRDLISPGRPLRVSAGSTKTRCWPLLDDDLPTERRHVFPQPSIRCSSDLNADVEPAGPPGREPLLPPDRAARPGGRRAASSASTAYIFYNDFGRSRRSSLILFTLVSLK